MTDTFRVVFPEDEEREEAVRTVGAAAQHNPDEVAANRQLAQRVGAEPSPSEHYNQFLRQAEEAQKAQRALENAPGIARFVGEFGNAAVAHDDIEALAAVEREWRKISDDARREGRPTMGPILAPAPTPWNLLKGIGVSVRERMNMTKEGLQMEVLDATGAWDSAHSREMAQRRYDEAAFTRELAQPEINNPIARGIYSGVESLASQALPLGVSILTRNPVPSLAAAGIGTQGEAYGRYTGRGATPGEAFLGATGEAGVEVATELIPMSKIVGSFGRDGKDALVEVLKGVLVDVPGEQIATLAQDAIDTAIANPDKTWGDYWRERPEAQSQTLIATLTQGGVISAISAAGTASANRSRAKDTADAIDRVSEIAAASKTRERDPEAFERAMRELEKEGSSTMYVNAEALAQMFQSNDVDPDEGMRGLGLDPALLTTARQEGGDVPVPVSVWMGRIAGSDAQALLRDHVKLNPNDMSIAEAKDFEARREELMGEAREATERAAAEAETLSATEQQMRGELVGMWQEGGRFLPEQAERMADLYMAAYRTAAQRSGTALEEFVAAYPLPNVVGPDGGVRRPSAPGAVGGAIVAASTASGVPEGYLTTLAKRESSFNPRARASTSSAEGLFQFIDTTWLNTVKAHGTPAQQALAKSIQVQGGRAVITSEEQRQLMAGRSDPAMASMMAAALTRDNARALQDALGRAPTEGELYAAHFLGAAGAKKLLTAQEGANAADLFKSAARANPRIFYTGRGASRRARTVAEVRAELGRGFGEGEIAAASGVTREAMEAAASVQARQAPDGPAFVPLPGSEVTLEQRAFHGTPHYVDRFSTDRIGTGEGHQEYGWGLYFAGEQKVAEYYRERLAGPPAEAVMVHAKAEGLPHYVLGMARRAMELAARDVRGRAQVQGRRSITTEEVMGHLTDEAARRVFGAGFATPDVVERAVSETKAALESGAITVALEIDQPGNLYEVELPGTEQFLDYEQPIAAQPPQVREAIAKLPESIRPLDATEEGNVTGQRLYNRLQLDISRNPLRYHGILRGAVFEDPPAKNASKVLASLGLAGLRYRDQFSRDLGADEGSYNFVVFRDDAVQMVSYAQATIQEAAEQTGTSESAFKRWFKDSKVVGPDGQPMMVFHGAKRGDRIDAEGRFRADRATSGPMPYFTTDPELAAKYAEGKEDTSYEIEDYEALFTINGVALAKAWDQLPIETRVAIRTKGWRVGKDEDDGDNIRMFPEDEGGLVGRETWEHYLRDPREGKGNGLRGLYKLWVESGAIFGEEEKFLQVLAAFGIKGAAYEDPHAAFPTVFPVYLSIQNPLDAANIPDDLLADLRAAALAAPKPEFEYGMDQWDKRAMDPRFWLELLDQGEFQFTVIPDWVTAVLRKHGYDGVADKSGKTRQHAPSDVWVPFDETQVKSVFNYGGFNPEDPRILFQGFKGPPGLYTALGRALETSKLTKAPPAQWIATLQNTPGVKKEELEWTGIVDLLQAVSGEPQPVSVTPRPGAWPETRMGFTGLHESWWPDAKGNLTREQLLAYVNGHGVKVEEKLKGGLTDPDTGYEMEEVEARPGEWQWQITDTHSGQVVSVHYTEEEALDWLEIETERSATKYEGYKLGGGDDTYRELLLILPSIQGPTTHWDEKNVMAHARFTERTDAEGSRILFLEEVQSDWHQTGRDKGYASEATPEKVNAALDAVEAARDALHAVQEDFVRSIRPFAEQRLLQLEDMIRRMIEAAPSPIAGSRLYPAEWDEQSAEIAQFIRDMDAAQEVAATFAQYRAEDGGDPTPRWSDTERAVLTNRAMGRHFFEVRGLMDRALGEGASFRLIEDSKQLNLRVSEARQSLSQLKHGIADAPFKSSWASLVMKRMIRYAVDNGFDKVAWTRADQIGPIVGKDPEGLEWFYGRNLVNDTNAIIKKHGARVADMEVHFGRDPGGISGVDAMLGAGLPTPEATGAEMDQYWAHLPFDERNRLIEQERDRRAIQTQRGFIITPQLAEAARGGFALFQRKDPTEGKRGSITLPGGGLGGGRQATISLFAGRDFSTVAHEGGHLFLEMLLAMGRQPGAPQQIQDDLKALREWWNIPTDAEITVREHEMFAEGFEQYLYEGRAPSLGLQQVFESFRQWLVFIYRKLRGVRADLSDEVRGVMDRLLATDQEIADAQASQGFKPLFDDPVAAGLGSEMAGVYTELHERARAQAHAEADARVLAALQRQEQEWYRTQTEQVREEVAADVAARPVYRAFEWLAHHAWIGGDPPSGLPEMKLSRRDIVRDYGEPALRALPRGWQRLYADEGVHPDIAAEAFGFASGAEMLGALTGMEKRGAVIDAETKAAMAERHPDPVASGEIGQIAVKAAHNASQQRIIELELQALTGRAVQSGLREAARREVAARTVADLLRPDRHLAAERRAANAAQRAYKAGDVQEAGRQKYRQLVSYHAWRATRDAAEEIEQTREYARKFERPGVRKSLDGGYIEQIDALLEQFDFRKASRRQIERQESLLGFVQRMEAEGLPHNIDPRLVESAQRRNYATLTMEELRGLRDTLRSIEKLGRLKKTLLDNRRRADLDSLVLEALSQGLMMPKVYDVADLTLRKPKGLIDRMVKAIGNADADLTKIEFLADELDGERTVDGVFNRVLINPATDAANMEEQLQAAVGARLRRAYDSLPKEVTDRWEASINAPELRSANYPTLRMTRGHLIAVALNMGNLSNMEKMAAGYGWEPDAIMKALDRELAAEEWQFIQEVWDALDELWPQIERVERVLTGTAPERVEALPVTTRHGVFRGGYYPVVYDSMLDHRLRDLQAKDANDMFGGMLNRAATPSGHTKTRTSYTGPVILDVPRVVFGHLNDAIKRISYAEYAISARAFLTDPRIDQMLNERLGPQYARQFLPWLQRQITDGLAPRDVQTALHAVARHARTAGSVVGMGFRVTTVLAQVAGLGPAANEVGSKWLGAAILEYMRSPLAARRFVMQKSGEMRSRGRNIDRDMRDLQREMEGETSILDQTRLAAFWMIGFMDVNVVSTPTWMAAYRKAIVEGRSEESAVNAADKAVRRSQGASRAKDMSKWQDGGEFERLFTMFYSYFAVHQNQMASSIRQATRGNFAPLMGVAFWWLTIAPLAAALLTGDWPDDDEDKGWPQEWLEWSFHKSFWNLFAGIPFLRDVASVAGRYFTGDYAAYSVTPAARVVDSATSVARDIENLTTGEDVSERWLKHAIEFPGYIWKLPTGQVANTVQYLADVIQGDQRPENVFQVLTGLTKGPQKDQE